MDPRDYDGMNSYFCLACRGPHYAHVRGCVTKAKEIRLANARVQTRIDCGLPAHERCLCGECVAWRADSRNINRLRAA